MPVFDMNMNWLPGHVANRNWFLILQIGKGRQQAHVGLLRERKRKIDAAKGSK